MQNSVASEKSRRRKSSRTNSTSSSVVTVKKVASLSSRSGSRTPRSTARAKSPEQLGLELGALLHTNSEAALEANRSLSPGHPSSFAEVRDGVGNLNRWSHSTTSSFSGRENDHGSKRRVSVSKHLSIGLHLPLESPPVPKTSELPRSQNLLAGTHQSPGSRLLRHDAATLDPALSLPDLTTLLVPSGPTYASDTPSTDTATPLTADLLTPSILTYSSKDYFGEKWSSRSAASTESLPLLATEASDAGSARLRSRGQAEQTSPATTASRHVAQVAKLAPGAEARSHRSRTGHSRSRGQDTNGTVEKEHESSTSSTRNDRQRLRKQKSPTQKTMLSQALEKANMAVQLDNAQNFEGAIDAYEEACRLLHEVMLRSSGDDDRKKLEAIVSAKVSSALCGISDNFPSKTPTQVASKNSSCLLRLLQCPLARTFQKGLQTRIP